MPLSFRPRLLLWCHECRCDGNNNILEKRMGTNGFHCNGPSNVLPTHHWAVWHYFPLPQRVGWNVEDGWQTNAIHQHFVSHRERCTVYQYHIPDRHKKATYSGLLFAILRNGRHQSWRSHSWRDAPKAPYGKGSICHFALPLSRLVQGDCQTRTTPPRSALPIVRDDSCRRILLLCQYLKHDSFFHHNRKLIDLFKCKNTENIENEQFSDFKIR